MRAKLWFKSCLWSVFAQILSAQSFKAQQLLSCFSPVVCVSYSKPKLLVWGFQMSLGLEENPLWVSTESTDPSRLVQNLSVSNSWKRSGACGWISELREGLVVLWHSRQRSHAMQTIPLCFYFSIYIGKRLTTPSASTY